MDDAAAPRTDVPMLAGPATVLVTGGAGFIGSNLCHSLVARGLSVRAFDNLSTGALANLAGLEAEVDFIQGDVTDPTSLLEAMRGVNLVLHHAALPSVPRSIEQPIASHAANATGTLNVLIAARAARVKRVVYASSSSVYGNSAALPKRESMAAAPISPYAAAKLAGEHYCHVFHHLHGLEVVVLRYFNVFGPRQDCDSPYAAVIPRFIKSLLAGEPPTIYGDGEQSRDFTYVGNVVQANLLALTVPGAAGGVFNIACQRATTLNQLYRAVQGALQVVLPPRYAPARPGEARHSLADISRAESVLGYQPIIDMEEGLRRTVRYWRGQDPDDADPCRAGIPAMGGQAHARRRGSSRAHPPPADQGKESHLMSDVRVIKGPAPQKGKPQPATEGRDVLVVDDEAGVGLLLREALSRYGHRVVSVTTGQSAMEEARQCSFDVVFLDIRMPGMNGLETLKALHRLLPKATFVMITAYAESGLVDESLDSGAFLCLSKPLSIRQVAALIEGLT